MHETLVDVRLGRRMGVTVLVSDSLAGRGSAERRSKSQATVETPPTAEIRYRRRCRQHRDTHVNLP